MIEPIDSQMVEAVKQTASAIQNDTLDNIAYRFFGSRSNDYLPFLIELNPTLSPIAIVPMDSEVVLPADEDVATTTTLKIWD